MAVSKSGMKSGFRYSPSIACMYLDSSIHHMLQAAGSGFPGHFVACHPGGVSAIGGMGDPVRGRGRLATAPRRFARRCRSDDFQPRRKEE